MSGLVASRRLDLRWWHLAMVMSVLLGGHTGVTAGDVTTQFVSTNVPLTLPQVGAPTQPVNSTVQVSGILTPVIKVTVSLYITHRYPSDAVIRLIPPAGGNGVLLIGANRIYSTQVPGYIGVNQFYNSGASASTGLGTSNLPAGRVVFDDAGVLIDPANTAHVNNGFNQIHLLPGIYRPQETLTTFSGFLPAQTNGTWTLRITDDFTEADNGRLVGWTLTITEPGTHTWTGAVDDDWSVAGNWLNNSPPNPNEIANYLIFPAGAAGTTNNDIVGDLRVGNWEIQGGGYTFTKSSADDLILVAGSTVTAVASSNIEVNTPINIIGQPTITVTGAGSFNLNGVIANNGVAAGLVLAGTGTKTLAGINTYTGATALNAGILNVANNTALGTNAAGTTVASGATVSLAGGLTVPETISIQGTGVTNQGALVFAGAGTTLNGIALVANQPTSITVVAGAQTVSTVTPAGAVAPHTLSIANGGSIAINGALPTTTALSLSGGTTTFGANQPNITTLALSNGADLNVGGFITTISGAISSGAAAVPGSEISGTTLNLAGVGHTISVAAGAAGTGGSTNTTSSDLLISANMTAGSFTKSGSGVLRITGNNTGVAARVTGGTLAGTGNIGAINVTNGILSPSGQFTVGGAVNLAHDTALILPTGASANPAIAATGAVTLNGSGGATGAVLQAFAGAGNVIITGGSVTGTFNGKPNGAGITYNAASVQLAASGGRTMAFNPPGPFVVNENVGTLVVTVVASAGGTDPVLRTFGGGMVESRDLTLVGTAGTPPGGATYTFNIPIGDNFVETGDLSATLVIVPQDGSLVTNSASITIRDNDKEDQKTCGFGTGLTVFLLLGFGLLLHVRLRRL